MALHRGFESLRLRQNPLTLPARKEREPAKRGFCFGTNTLKPTPACLRKLFVAALREITWRSTTSVDIASI